MKGFDLNWLGEKIVDRVDRNIDRLTEEIANDIAADAKQLCPKDSGNLSNSIKVERSKYSGHLVRVGGGSEYYASFVEMGTRRQKKEPFMRPALKKNKAKALSKVTGRLI